MQFTIKTLPDEHRGQKVVFLQFPRDESLIATIHAHFDACWSATKRMWYLPAARFDLHELLAVMQERLYKQKKTKIIC